jgi:hypothetical protein
MISDQQFLQSKQQQQHKLAVCKVAATGLMVHIWWWLGCRQQLGSTGAV